MTKFNEKISIDFKCSKRAYKLLKLVDPNAYLALKDPHYLIEIAPEDYDAKANFEEKRFKVMVKLKKALSELTNCKVIMTKGSRTIAGFNLISTHAQYSESDSVFFGLTDIGAKWLEANRTFFSDSGIEHIQNKYHFFKPEYDWITPADLLKMKI